MITTDVRRAVWAAAQTAAAAGELPVPAWHTAAGELPPALPAAGQRVG